LGNILFFEGEVEAAQFFVEKAFECAAEDQWTTRPQQDLETIRSRKI
jgi:hypothetical protein